MIRKIIRKLLRVLTRNEIRKQHYALGINSYVDKDKDLHIIMLDYDTNNFKEVLEDCKELTKFWKLSDFEIYTTKNGYHIFFWWDIVPYSRLKMIIDYSKCDSAYKYISKFYEYKTVRCLGKYKDRDIKFVGRFSGVRSITKDDKELGDLKRKEYQLLKQQKIFNEGVLK